MTLYPNYSNCYLVIITKKVVLRQQMDDYKSAYEKCPETIKMEMKNKREW